MSDGASTRDHRITKACFRICSTCRSRSQAPFYLCALRTIANRAEGTFALLRYTLGGDRPSQTAHIPLFQAQIHGTRLELKYYKSGISHCGSVKAGASTSTPPTYSTHRMPKPNNMLQERFIGSFRLPAGTQYLHCDFSFAESLAETEPILLRYSCGSELTRQGTSLP